MLIGLNGRKQAGKDTVFERASHLLRDVVEVERVSFADLLYRSAAEAIGVTVRELQAWKENPRMTVRVVFDDVKFGCEVNERVLTIREYLQRYGTEAHRDVFGPDFWVEQVEATLNAHKLDGRVLMVTDVRFPNEAEAVRRVGGSVVEVIGPEGRVTADAHASEAPLPEGLIDVTLANTIRDDGFQALDAQVRRLFALHLGGVPVLTPPCDRCNTMASCKATGYECAVTGRSC